jgi:RNA recognition motif-containing protein
MNEEKIIGLFIFKTDKKKTVGSSSSNGGSRNLWVSGLSTSTRATDLKHHFSKFGKVRTTS